MPHTAQLFYEGRIRRIVVLVLCSVSLTAATGNRILLLEDCSDSSESMATLDQGTELRVVHSVAGSTQTCYAVSATVDGKSISGYVLGADHPAITSFEREARSRVPLIPVVPAPPPAPKEDAKNSEKPAEKIVPPGPSSFAGLRMTDQRGKAVNLDAMGAQYVVLYFWAPGDRKVIRDSAGLEQLYDQYHRKGIDLVGVGSGLKSYLQEVEAVWPLVPDSGEIAARYKVNRETPYYILDRQRNVIATAKRSTDIVPELQKLGKLPR